ncbi:MAG: tryptophan synthase subunit alpha, partial [Planctomycetes bacterium]|nr:tryptophan synthase subunit alpha [Planctomycetota bacterium]
ALATNVRVAQILDMVTSLRRETQIPIVAMVSYSIVFKHTAEKFIADALAAGIDGATIPDMTAEQETALFRLGERMGFRIACFVAPTTTDHRRELLAQSAQGFIYYIAVAGITGVRDRLPDDMTANLAALRRATDKPIALGFGVSTPQQARIVGQHADGVIVGSAIVRLIEANREKPLPQLVATVGQFVRELAVAAKGRL